MLIQADASALEWRVLIELAQDKVAIQEVVNKEDTHSKNQEAFGLPSRLISKKYLFRTIYRGTGWAFANDNDFLHVSSDPHYWDDINEKFYTKYKGVDNCHKKWYDISMKDQNIVGPLGREWYIPLERDKYNNLKLPINKITNYPVQGTGADIILIARVSFFNKLKKLGLQDVIKLISTVHDSIVVDAPLEYLELCIQLFHEAFASLIPNIKKIFGYTWVTPLTCECKYGTTMSQMEKEGK